MGKDDKVKVSDIFIWRDRADDIIGYEMDPFVHFMQNTYLKKKTIFSVTMKQLRQALVTWMKFENIQTNEKFETHGDTESLDDLSIIQDDS